MARDNAFKHQSPLIFDSNSAIRERLYLLSKLSNMHDSANWTYNSHFDAWHSASGQTLHISYEGSESLDKLAAKGVNRAMAMHLIGYGELPW